MNFLESRINNPNEVGNNKFLAIEITNPLMDSQDLRFLGQSNWLRQNDKLKIRSIIGDELCDDPNLKKLGHHIMSSPILINGVCFNTSCLNDIFKEKIFTCTNVDCYGNTSMNPYNLSRYYNPKSENHQSLNIDMTIYLDANHEFMQTKIQPFERLVIFFNTHRGKKQQAIESMIEHANKIYDREKNRNLMLIM